MKAAQAAKVNIIIPIICSMITICTDLWEVQAVLCFVCMCMCMFCSFMFVKPDPVAQILSEIVNIDSSKLEQRATAARWKSYIASVLLDLLDGKS